jgi:4-hydroxybenzoate polyprenyltransferase
VAAALRTSVATHVVTVALLLAYGAAADLGAAWWVGVALTTAALAYEHAIVRPHDLSRVNRAFFTVNGYVGIGLFAFGVLAL